MAHADAILHQLGETLEGALLLPDDARFSSAATIWNGSAVRPKAIAQCANPGDVQRAIAAARDAGLPLSIRAGGHDWVGRAMCHGLVIDLTRMSAVEADADLSSVKVGGGARASDLARCTDPLGKTAAVGSIGAVGVAGLTLGGGYGPLIARYGLACDNLIGARVVLADGSIVRAGDREGEDSDLLWALKGGGGNFGVVVELELALHPVAEVHGGSVFYPVDQAADVLSRLNGLQPDLGDELTFQLAFISTPDGAPVLGVIPSWVGAANEAEERLAKFQHLGQAVFTDLRKRSFSEALSMFDGSMTDTHRVSMEVGWVTDLNPEVVDVLARSAREKPSPGCSIVTHEFRGAAARAPAEATAFGFRRPHLLVEFIAQYDDAGGRERAWLAASSKALSAVALPGGYANFLDRDDQRASATFGPNAGRLRTLKDRYDPQNLFNSTTYLPPA